MKNAEPKLFFILEAIFDRIEAAIRCLIFALFLYIMWLAITG